MRKKISAAFAGTVAEHAYVTTYCCSERSRRAYCPSKSWLTRTNATGRNDLQTAKTIIPRKKSCSRYSMYDTIDDFSCTETQADGSYSEGIPKKLFFFLRCRRQAKQQNNKSFVPTSPGVARDSFFFFFYLFILFILLIQFNFVTYVRPLKTPAHDDCQSPLPGQVGPGLTV